MRDNVEAESPENYFRKSITVPFLDYTLNEMKTRSTDIHARTALGLQLLDLSQHHIYIFVAATTECIVEN
jgi:hypothetical protein